MRQVALHWLHGGYERTRQKKHTLMTRSASCLLEATFSNSAFMSLMSIGVIAFSESPVARSYPSSSDLRFTALTIARSFLAHSTKMVVETLIMSMIL